MLAAGLDVTWTVSGTLKGGAHLRFPWLWAAYYDLTEQSGNREVPLSPPTAVVTWAWLLQERLFYDTTLQQPSNGSLTPHLLASGRWLLHASEKVLGLV